METLILTGDKKSEMNLIVEIARKFGIKTRKLSIEDMEDIGLLRGIKDGETGEYVNTNEFLDSIRRKWSFGSIKVSLKMLSESRISVFLIVLQKGIQIFQDKSA